MKGQHPQVEADQATDTQMSGQLPHEARTDYGYRTGEQRSEAPVLRLIPEPEREDHDDGKPRVGHAEQEGIVGAKAKALNQDRKEAIMRTCCAQRSQR